MIQIIIQIIILNCPGHAHVHEKIKKMTAFIFVFTVTYYLKVQLVQEVCQ